MIDVRNLFHTFTNYFNLWVLWVCVVDFPPELSPSSDTEKLSESSSSKLDASCSWSSTSISSAVFSFFSRSRCTGMAPNQINTKSVTRKCKKAFVYSNDPVQVHAISFVRFVHSNNSNSSFYRFKFQQLYMHI